MKMDQREKSHPRTITLPDEHYRALSLLVSLGDYRSRSAAICRAIEDLAEREIGPAWRDPRAILSRHATNGGNR